MKLFDTEDTGISTEDSADSTMTMDDIDISYEDMRISMERIDMGGNHIQALEAQIAIEEAALLNGDINLSTISLSRESLRNTMADLGLEYVDMNLSTEAANLPSTQVDMDTDMRKSIDAKKGIISKIIDAIKKIFAKLYIKAVKLYAAISVLVNNNKKALVNYIAKLSKGDYNSVFAGSKSNYEISKRAGMYYVLNDQTFDTTLLESLMYDMELLKTATADINALASMQRFDMDSVVKAVKLRSDTDLEYAPLTKNMMLLSDILKGKDTLSLLKTGKVVGLSPTSIKLLTITETDSDDVMVRLASRKIVANHVSLPYNQIVSRNAFPGFTSKENLIDFLKDLLKIVNNFEQYNKSIDKFVADVDKLYKDLSKSVVSEANGVMQSSITMYNKLLLDISTTKRITVVKTINALVAVGGTYANSPKSQLDI